MFGIDWNKHSPYSPASNAESPEYARFANRFALTFSMANIALAYLLSAVFMSYTNTITFVTVLFTDRMIERVRDLHAYDGMSHYFYVGTIVAGAVCAIPILFVEFYAYWSKVIKPGLAHPFEVRTAIGMLMLLALCAFLLYFAFLKDIELGSFRTQGVYLWLIFPLWASIICSSVSSLSSMVLAGFYKFFAQIRGGYDA